MKNYLELDSSIFQRYKNKKKQIEKEKTKEKKNDTIKIKEKDEKIIEKNKEKEKEKEKVNQIEKSKFTEIKLNQKRKRNTENLNSKSINNQENKKTISPKNNIHFTKIVKTKHHHQNLTNITQNINLNKKVNTYKSLKQKTEVLDNIVPAKNPSKTKQNFKTINTYNNNNINNNNVSQKIKKIANMIPNYKKINIEKLDNNNLYFNNERKRMKLEIKEFQTFKEIKPYDRRIKNIESYDDNRLQRLKTEIIQVKNKNYINNKKQMNYINNTIDNINNHIGFISDIKKNILIDKDNRKKYNLNSFFIEKRKKNERIKSTNFSDNNTMTINTTYSNSMLKTNMIQKNKTGKRFLNKLQLLPNKDSEIFRIDNYSNRKSNLETDILRNIANTEPSNTNIIQKINNNKNINFNTLKTNIDPNTILYNRVNRETFLQKMNNKNNSNINQTSASYLKYLEGLKKFPTFNNNSNLVKNVASNEILKTEKYDKERNIIIPKSSESLSSSKKNPYVILRNTVINFNMIENGLLLPKFNSKIQDDKKFNMNYPYTTTRNQNHIQAAKKISKDSLELYRQKTNINNNSIYKISNRSNISNNNNSSFKPLFKHKTISNKSHFTNYSLSLNQNNINNKDLLYTGYRRINTQAQEKVSTISSFNKLVNNIKNKQIYNKIPSSSIERNHLKFKSMKLNELYLKTNQKNENKTLEINGVNSKYKAINMNKNYNLPSLIIKTKKFYIPKRKGDLIPQNGKTLKLISPMQQNSFNYNFGRPTFSNENKLKI